MIGHDRLTLLKVVECPACDSVNAMLRYEQHLRRCYFCRECQHHWEVSPAGVATRPPVIKPADRAEMIGVESYIDDLRGECEDQTQKIAQLERQLDDLRATVRELMGTSG